MRPFGGTTTSTPSASLFNGAANMTGAATSFMPATGLTTQAAASGAADTFSAPVLAAITLNTLRCRCPLQPAAGKTLTTTVFKNGVATALTVQFTNADAAGTQRAIAAAVALAVNDRWEIQVIATEAAPVTWSVST